MSIRVNGPYRRLLSRLAVLSILIIGLLYVYYEYAFGKIRHRHESHGTRLIINIERNAALNNVPEPGTVEKALVTAKMRKEDVSWAHELKPE